MTMADKCSAHNKQHNGTMNELFSAQIYTETTTKDKHISINIEERLEKGMKYQKKK